MFSALTRRNKEQAPGKMVGGDSFNIVSMAVSKDSPVLELPGDHFNSNRNHLVTGLDSRLPLALADTKSTVFHHQGYNFLLLFL